jgi:excisionase family DNA binding protein
MGARKKAIAQAYYSTGDIAKLIGKSTETIRRAIKSGELRSELFNGNYVVRVEDFLEWKARVFKPIAHV